MYYHVSRLVKEGQILEKKTKNFSSFCDYISNCDVSTYKKLIECYKFLCSEHAFDLTDRKEGKWCCEAIFEHIRKIEYPDKPSRIWSVYLFSNIDDAYSFLNKYRNRRITEAGEELMGHIYQIDVPEEKVHTFDMNIYTEADEKLRFYIEKDLFENSLYEFVCDKAREYWRGTVSNNPQYEILVDCDVTVGKMII